jgi:CBS domain-containing protein
MQAPGGIAAGTATALREALDVITRLRFAHHASAIDGGRPPDNMIDPGALSPIARTDLREALASVKRAQKPLSVYAPVSR